MISVDGPKDPAMVGEARYARNPLDFYPTPKRATDALLSVFGDDIGAMLVWEPFCGNGAVSKIVTPYARDLISTDIKAYEGFDADGLVDFFNVKTDLDPSMTGDSEAKSMADIAAMWPVAGFGALEDEEKVREIGAPRPDAIITNPPYGKIARRCIEHALKLMEQEKGFVAMLLRSEYDSAVTRKHLFRDHPAFRAEVKLLFRPRWVEGSKGAPRHNYSWFIWDWVKPAGLKAEKFYAE